MSQLCDGIQCRLTAGTAGSAKSEILVVQLENKQTDEVKNTKAVNKKEDITVSCKQSLTQNRTNCLSTAGSH